MDSNDLDSPVPMTPQCNKKSIFLRMILPVVFVSVTFVLLSVLFCMYYRRRMSKTKPQKRLSIETPSPSVTSFNHDRQFFRVSYEELLNATTCFSDYNLIGVGSYSHVYKGVLHQVNTTVAVKVLNLQQRGAPKSFLSECNALRNLRHRNLLKIITCCSSVDSQGNDFKALVFKYMPNGSLEEWLGKDELRHLSFLQRLNIAIEVASAVKYLHHDCQPTILHCDLKPSNILLDENMTAHVADFGLAKIFSGTSYKQSQGSSLAVKGSIGYIAPEYGLGGEVTKKGDVYSFGILLLEMFTGKKPTDCMFQNGRNLHSFAKMTLPEQVVDPSMLLEGHDITFDTPDQITQKARLQECLVSAIRLGVACSDESPIKRMEMRNIVTQLYRIKDHLEGVSPSGVTKSILYQSQPFFKVVDYLSLFMLLFPKLIF